MRKYLIAIAVIILLIAAGITYRILLVPQELNSNASGVVKEIAVTIPLHSWSFEPSNIDAEVGDTLSITVTNNDDIEHGFAIDEYQISRHLAPGERVTLPKFVLDKKGTFEFFCSVVCGGGVSESGTHRGVERGHFDMSGTLTVGSLPPTSTSTTR